MTTTATPTVAEDIQTALVSALNSAAVQAALLSAVTSGEVQVQAFVDDAINAAKANGVLGIVIAAAKGSVESEVNAYMAAFTPAQIVAFITKEAVYAVDAL